MVVGILNILFSIYGIVTSVLFLAGVMSNEGQFDEMMQQGGDQAEFAKTMMQFTQAMQGPIGLVANVLTLGLAGVIIMGAAKMKNLQSYGLAMAASIIAMIPCLSNCCIIGLPIGIWALIVLVNDDVKNSFR
jgi:hypothetical protein